MENFRVYLAAPSKDSSTVVNIFETQTVRANSWKEKDGKIVFDDDQSFFNKNWVIGITKGPTVKL